MRRILKKIMYVWIGLFFFLLFFRFDISDDLRIKKIADQIQKFTNEYEQQKIYVHTDKEIYMAGEAIWLKAYLIKAKSFLPDSSSKEIYVDLIDYSNKHVKSIILRNVGGFGIGDITLSDTLAEGNYEIRAYTNWMRNFDKDFFFNKTVQIKNPNYENVITNLRLKYIKIFNKKLKRMSSHYNMHFFPEGGDLVGGMESKVAFKAENDLGHGVGVTGAVYDKKGNKLANIVTKHNGMGYFVFTPVAGESYYARVVYENGDKSKVALPQVMEKGISILTDPFSNDKIRMRISSNRSISENVTSNEVIIIGQSRGNLLYASKGELLNKSITVEIPRKIFPAGIAQITVFDSRLDPVCERLVFIDQSVETSQNKLKFSQNHVQDTSVFSLSLLNKDGVPVKSNLSVSVKEVLPGNENQSQSNILTQLLLTSDLKGRVEDPEYYFGDDPSAKQDIDLVMLTHGWRRFVWKEILAGNFPTIDNPREEGISIGGRITRDFFEIPVPNTKVKLSILSAYNDVYETTTDRKGRFLFTNLDYEDTIDVKIESSKPGGGKAVQIIVGDTVVPEITTPVNPAVRYIAYNKENIRTNNRRERLEFKKHYKGKPEPDNQMFKIHNTPNDVIYVGQDVSSYSNILQYMQGKVPGVNITGDRVIIRGINTFYGSTDPLFLMDGVPIEASSVSSLNPLDISVIEILKGPEAAIYGSRGANGVIAFYSRRGEFMKRGEISFGMLGYHKVREFYVPDYENWKYQPVDYNVPRILYWKPLIFTDNNGQATVKFRNLIDAKNRQITIEGLTSTGELIHMVVKE